jgi:hypothetical protein
MSEMSNITRKLVESSNHHAGDLAELLEGAASEIDLLRDEKADLVVVVNALRAERDRYKAALDKFGRHGQWCRGNEFEDGMAHCDCGLAQAVRP